MTYRVRNIGIAVALAAVAALFTSFYVTSYKRHVQRGEDQVTVLVAKHDIAPGTPGAEASKGLASLQVPRRSVVHGAISSPDEIQNLVATQKTLEGEQVTVRRFSPVAENGVRADLKGNLRGMQVQGDINQTLAGTLRDGGHVDVVATFKYHFAGALSPGSACAPARAAASEADCVARSARYHDPMSSTNAAMPSSTTRKTSVRTVAWPRSLRRVIPHAPLSCSKGGPTSRRARAG